MLLACLFKWCSGVYVGDECPEDRAMFVTEKCCFTDLVNGLSSPCLCGQTMKPWQLESVTQVSNDDVHAHTYMGMHLLVVCQFQKGHVLRTVFACRHCRQKTWSSSRIHAGHYLVNQKFVVCLLL
jgi:hypothetical protein